MCCIHRSYLTVSLRRAFTFPMYFNAVTTDSVYSRQTANPLISWKILKQGRGNRPQKPTKVTLFTIILYNSENNIRDIRPSCRLFFVTTVLWRILHLSYSSEAVMTHETWLLNITEIDPRKLTGSIHSRFEGQILSMRRKLHHKNVKFVLCFFCVSLRLQLNIFCTVLVPKWGQIKHTANGVVSITLQVDLV